MAHGAWFANPFDRSFCVFVFFLKGIQLESDLFLIYLFLVLLGLGRGPQAQ